MANEDSHKVALGNGLEFCRLGPRRLYILRLMLAALSLNQTKVNLSIHLFGVFQNLYVSSAAHGPRLQLERLLQRNLRQDF